MSQDEIVGMRAFFNRVADTYDAHMHEVLEERFDSLYEAVSTTIVETRKPIRVLDLGCGTGAELHWLFQKAPNALVTCVDLSEGMLGQLLQKYAGKEAQLTLIRDSYETVSIPDSTFDYCVSVMSFHHYEHERKRALYNRILRALKSGGRLVVGDFVVGPADETQYMADYHAAVAAQDPELYHCDIPFTVGHELGVMAEAGYVDTDCVHKHAQAAVLIGNKC
jgi:tRNA (cmo5U34)-methyltransferase